jgi:TRAP-type C4-dicarboxylate transport system permease small subunit
MKTIGISILFIVACISMIYSSAKYPTRKFGALSDDISMTFTGVLAIIFGLYLIYTFIQDPSHPAF